MYILNNVSIKLKIEVLRDPYGWGTLTDPAILIF